MTPPHKHQLRLWLHRRLPELLIQTQVRMRRGLHSPHRCPPPARVRPAVALPLTTPPGRRQQHPHHRAEEIQRHPVSQSDQRAAVTVPRE